MTAPQVVARCPLSVLDRQVLSLLADGRTRAEFPPPSVSAATPSTPPSAGCFTKTNTNGTTHLVAVAIRNGWIK